jgi:hypothetical protein
VSLKTLLRLLQFVKNRHKIDEKGTCTAEIPFHREKRRKEMGHEGAMKRRVKAG